MLWPSSGWRCTGITRIAAITLLPPRKNCSPGCVNWLSIARTANAKSKIRRYLKTHERHINIQIGRERLDRELRTLGPRDLQAASEDAEQWLCDEYHLESFEDLLAAIGADDVRPHGV